jgi:hypothetical protein
MRELLSEISFEFFKVDSCGRHGMSEPPAADEMTRGLRRRMITNKISMWLVFAVQVYLDIRYILETDVSSCNKEILGTSQKLQATLKDYVDFGHGLHSTQVNQEVPKRLCGRLTCGY